MYRKVQIQEMCVEEGSFLYWLHGSKPNCTSITPTAVSVNIMINMPRQLKVSLKNGNVF